jgi:hypothetical protein
VIVLGPWEYIGHFDARAIMWRRMGIKSTRYAIIEEYYKWFCTTHTFRFLSHSIDGRWNVNLFHNRSRAKLMIKADEWLVKQGYTLLSEEQYDKIKALQ